MLRSKLLWLCCALAWASAGLAGEFDDAYETVEWQELEVQLPAPPTKDSLVPFFVSSVTNNQFYVDVSTLTVGVDGVVRYVLVVTSAEGARSVSFEAIRCETRERRIYATGRRDGGWAKSRNNQWERIRESAINRHHASLFQEYFCPWGVIVNNAEEAKKALALGGHPDRRYQ